jgi:hypothetical protein
MAPPGHVDMQHTALPSTSCSHTYARHRSNSDRHSPINTGHLSLDSRLASRPPSLITHHYTCSARRSVLDTTLSRFTYWLDLMKLHFCEHLLHIYLAFLHSTGAWEGSDLGLFPLLLSFWFCVALHAVCVHDTPGHLIQCGSGGGVF